MIIQVRQLSITMLTINPRYLKNKIMKNTVSIQKFSSCVFTCFDRCMQVLKLSSFKLNLHIAFHMS